MSSVPIAIVGTGCVLPGALSRKALWQLVRGGGSAISDAPRDLWGIAPEIERARLAREVVSRAGGRIDGFERAFSTDGFNVPVDPTLDPVFLWTLHAAREALREAGRDVTRVPVRGAFVLGNLSYPTPGLIRYAMEVWQEGPRRIDPRNRFMSGLPAALAARAIGFEGPAFALDAACASSLYAIKLACDRLADGSVELAIAGGVNHADDLFLHLGFTALSALSPSGRSRPFHREADGLLPAQGAALVLLKRLAEAERDGDRVLGVIRGVGLSNDGRSRGLLVPSEEGQIRAMRAAYGAAGVDPASVSLVECHATGTAVGDSAEVRSLSTVFAEARDVPVGSLKSNLGHLITAAGAAGLLKVIAAIEARERPPTLNAEVPLDELAGTPLRLLHAAEPWPGDGPRRAAVSAFGFGGNNAHLVVDEWSGPRPKAALPMRDRPASPSTPLAVIAMTARAGTAVSAQEFEAAVLGDGVVRGGEARASDFEMKLDGVRFPPADLADALPQQLWLLDAVLSLRDVVDRLPAKRTAILAGMQCDAEVARSGLAWRLQGVNSGRTTDGPLTAAVTIGCMPNIVANRVSHQLGLEAPSFAVSAEEASGTVALELAGRALAAHEIDAAIVAAVDLSCEPVQRSAAAALLPAQRQEPGDGCAVLVLKRLCDARRDGDAVLAVLGGDGDASSELILDEGTSSLAARFGHAHAASGLLLVSAAMAVIRRTGSGPIRVRIRPLGGCETSVLVQAGDPGGAAPSQPSSTAHLPGNQLRVPAHLPPVRIRSDEDPQLMPAPPRLPPVRARAAATSHGDGRVPAGPAAIASIHTAFVRRQSELHQRFLEVLSSPGSRAPVRPPAARPTSPLPGPKLSRQDLEALASGPISAVLGPLFREQDSFRRVVRMPEPPLLLVDRVTGIEGEPGSMGLGTIWTETDIAPGAWYLHDGRMPAGVMIEAGQADLLLISWLGVDRHNRGERVYRLLGCDLTSHGPLPGPGDTLSYEIHIDGHASQGAVRLFFFHYDCKVDGKVRLSVRGGQAGFFTDEELSTSAGILARAEDGPPTSDPRLDPPIAVSSRRRFSPEDVEHFASGRVRRCFGPGFERADTHTLTPTIPGGRMRLVDEVTEFDPRGGPWKRGYLRARLGLSPGQWFFAGHFKDDPCMPGTLMFEGALQAMAFYLAALGFTLGCDGFRFEPVPEHTYRLRCRGQATPRSRELVYELFVDEIVGGATPTLYADLLGTVDGRKAFHCRRMGLSLVHGYPMDPGRMEVHVVPDSRPVARVREIAFDQRSLLACAWGRPSEAFGPMYARFDEGPRVPRLPGPPYHFMSRIASVSGGMGRMETGSTVVAEYDVPSDAWYFGDNGAPAMPFAVLLEVALQPCGWLASYAGCAISSGRDVLFRNLDGNGTVEREVRCDAGALSTTARLKTISDAAGVLIVAFDVEVGSPAGRVFSCETVFGFFSPDSMRDQPGLPDVDAAPPAPLPDHARVTLPAMPRGRLRMLDRIAGLSLTGGRAGIGRLIASRSLDAGDWFFRAHFMGDPVQPGSLGLEAMVQALEALVVAKGLAREPAAPRFEALAIGLPVTWKYRGQVLPENREITADVEITEIRNEPAGALVIGDGSLRVDGKRIYSARGIGVRLLGGHASRDSTRSVSCAPERYRGAWTQLCMLRMENSAPPCLPPATLHRTIPVLWVRSTHTVCGPLDPAALASAIADTFARYEILRSVVRIEGDDPSEPPTVEVLKDWLPGTECVDVARLSAAEQDARQEQFFNAPLDPILGPPARTAIFRKGNQEHTVCLSQHHLFTDGVSLIRFWREVLERCRALSEGRAPMLPDEGPSFARYCRAEQAWLDSDASAGSREYWRRTLDGAVPIRLPYDVPRDGPADFRGDRVEVTIPAGLVDRLEALCRREAAGMFAVLLLGLGATIRSATPQDEVLICTFHANRILPNMPDAFDVMGPVVGGALLRLRAASGAPVATRLAEAQSAVDGLLQHGAVPLEYMRHRMGLPLPAPRVSLVYQGFTPPASQQLGPLEVRSSEPLGFGKGLASFDLELVLWPDDGELRGVAAYSTQVFRKPTIDRLMAAFLETLASLASG